MGHEVDHGYSVHHCNRIMYWRIMYEQYVCIAHPDPKASEQEEQKTSLIDRCLRRRLKVAWPGKYVEGVINEHLAFQLTFVAAFRSAGYVRRLAVIVTCMLEHNDLAYKCKVGLTYLRPRELLCSWPVGRPPFLRIAAAPNS